MSFLTPLHRFTTRSSTTTRNLQPVLSHMWFSRTESVRNCFIECITCLIIYFQWTTSCWWRLRQTEEILPSTTLLRVWIAPSFQAVPLHILYAAVELLLDRFEAHPPTGREITAVCLLLFSIHDSLALLPLFSPLLLNSTLCTNRHKPFPHWRYSMTQSSPPVMMTMCASSALKESTRTISIYKDVGVRRLGPQVLYFPS